MPTIGVSQAEQSELERQLYTAVTRKSDNQETISWLFVV